MRTVCRNATASRPPNRFINGKARRNYASTSPITKASGNKKVVLARFVHNDRLADICHQWAFAGADGVDRSTPLLQPRPATPQPAPSASPPNPGVRPGTRRLPSRPGSAPRLCAGGLSWIPFCPPSGGRRRQNGQRASRSRLDPNDAAALRPRHSEDAGERRRPLWRATWPSSECEPYGAQRQLGACWSFDRRVEKTRRLSTGRAGSRSSRLRFAVAPRSRPAL